jgi:transcriptional regulator with XRE-family HTH domain
MTGHPLLNTELLRRRRAELGISLRAIADQVGIGAPAYAVLENGHGHANLELGVVVRLARTLGLDIGDLVLTEDGSHTERTEPGDDAAALGALLSATAALTQSGALCEALGWPLERLQAAKSVLEQRLAGVGMTFQRQSAAVKIVTAADKADRDAVARALRKHLARDHVSVIEARMLRAVELGAVPKQPTNPERVALGVLVNAELVGFAESGGRHREAPMVLADDVRFSLMLDDEKTSQ